MVEDMEIKMRNLIEVIYFGKTKEVFSTLRSTIATAELERRKSAQGQIGSSLKK